jgi:hypothetical protein
MKLDLLKMVIPFRCAQFLKNMGIKQHSLFYWVEKEDKVSLYAHPDLNILIDGYEVQDLNLKADTYSAFMTDELINVLREHLQSHPRLQTLGIVFKYRKYKSPQFDLGDNVKMNAALIDFMEAIEKHEEEKLRKHKAPKENENPKTDGNDL